MLEQDLRRALRALAILFLLSPSGCDSDECDAASVALPGNSYSKEAQNWHSTGMRVRQGELLSYRASGTIWDGIKSQDGSYLLGLVGGSRFTLIEGERNEVPATGPLFLSIDDNPAGSCDLDGCRGPGSCYCDNDGTLCLDIQRHGRAEDAGVEDADPPTQ